MIMKKLFLLMLLPLAISVVSCEKDDDSSENGEGVTPNNPKDVSITSSADVQSYHSVVLKGFANGANGMVGFCYSETDEDPNPDACPYVETSSIKSDNSYELTVDGLSPNTKYYYRAFATKDQMKVLAKEVKVFTTEEFKIEAVDLGLSVKWANCNVGASAPEAYGDYFAWGETEPCYTSGHAQDDPCSNWKSGKSGYNWSNYKYCNGSCDTMTKYCFSSNYGNVDNKTVLDAADDAATANWGGSWRMPTDTEMTELRTKCTWTWTTKNGVNGCNVEGPNGNSIFLPAAGYRYDSSLRSAGSNGYYWSSSLDANHSGRAYGLYFVSDDHDRDGSSRYCGFSVRAVCQ